MNKQMQLYSEIQLHTHANIAFFFYIIPNLKLLHKCSHCTCVWVPMT